MKVRENESESQKNIEKYWENRLNSFENEKNKKIENFRKITQKRIKEIKKLDNIESNFIRNLKITQTLNREVNENMKRIFFLSGEKLIEEENLNFKNSIKL